MEKQPALTASIDLKNVKHNPSPILKDTHSVLFIGFCSTGGGHTEREFNVVRAIIDRSFNEKTKATPEQVINAKKCLDHGSTVIVVLPPEWPVNLGMYFQNAHTFIQELRKPELKLNVYVCLGTKSATSLYERQGYRQAILRRHARFPFDDTPSQLITLDADVKKQHDLNPELLKALDGKQGIAYKDAFRAFIEKNCQKISMMDLVPQVAAACGDVKKIWCSTDMDFALTRAIHKVGVPGKQIVDHVSILNLFVENPYAGQALLEYCYMGKVLPSKVAFGGDHVPDPYDAKKSLLLSKTANISLSTLDIEHMKQPNTLIQLRSMVKVLDEIWPGHFLEDRKGPKSKSSGDGGAELRKFAWEVIQKAGKQLSLDEFAKSDGSIGGFLYGKGKLSELPVDDIKGFVYLYLSDATNQFTKYIAEQIKKEQAKKANTGYENIVFAICANGGFDGNKLTDAAKRLPEGTRANVMMYANLMGGDAVMQAGMGTSSEFAYSVVNGCREAKLLVWPMIGQDEHASNARFVNGLFPNNVTQIGPLNFTKALDDLVKFRNTPGKGLQPYGVEYVEGILSDYTIAETAADVLLDDKQLEEKVEDALINVSEPRLKVTYRLMKICVQMLDQLEGSKKVLTSTLPGATSEDGPWPYTKILGDKYQNGKFVIALRRGEKGRRIFKTLEDARKFFSTPHDIATFLEVDIEMLDQVYRRTKLTDRVLEALEDSKDKLVSGFARYALKDISDIVKSGV